MSLFDLLFAAVFLSTAGLLLAAAVAALAGRRSRVLRLLGGCALLDGIYLGALLLVSLLTPRRVLAVGEEQCWDDWCITVSQARTSPGKNGTLYDVGFRVASRALRRPQRERGVSVYLMDGQGRHWSSLPDAGAVPFSALLQPGQSVETSRRFELPWDAVAPVAVVSHGSAFPGRLVIGDSESLWHQPTVVRLPR